jgi:hypothetical protein
MKITKRKIRTIGEKRESIRKKEEVGKKRKIKRIIE